MKKIFLLTSAAIFFLGCTRASNTDSSKIQIQLPSVSSLAIQKTLGNGTEVRTSTLDYINCYGVFIGGPDKDMNRNSCALGKSKESYSNHSGGEMYFGDWVAGIPSGQKIELEIPSGNDRVVHLIGMRTSQPELCRNFKDYGVPNDDESSDAYLLGVAGQLNLKPGETVEVPIKISLNTEKKIVGCQGPDAPSGGGGGDHDGSNQPYLRFEGIGSYDYLLDIDKATTNICYAFRPSLFYGYGEPWIDANRKGDIHIDVAELGFGQFYSGSNCTSPVTDLVIPYGNSKSLVQYYFRSSTAVSSMDLGKAIFSGNSEPITGEQYNLDVGTRRLILDGPKRVVVNECYPYRVKSTLYEGGSLSVESAPLNVSLSDNAGFNFRTTSDCVSGTTTVVQHFTSEGLAYLRLNSAAAFSLSDYISAPGYVVAPFSVDSSGIGDHYDNLSLKVKDNKLIRGECNEMTISLNNADGGAVRAKNILDIRVYAPQGAGVFYANTNCTGSAVNAVQIVTGESYVRVWMKAHALPAGRLTAGRLPIGVDNGALKLEGVAAGTGSFAFVDVVDSNKGQLLVDAPSFSEAQIIGTHEFDRAGYNTYVEIPLLSDYSVNGLPTPECSYSSGTGFTTCPVSEVDVSSVPYKYRWSAANAASSTTRFVRFAYSNYTTQEIAISPYALYGADFRVITCTAVGTAGTQSLSSLVALSSSVVCLPANSTYSKSSSSGYSIDMVRVALIGHSSGTSVLDANGYAGALVEASSVTYSSDRYVANVKIQNLLSSSIGIRFDSVLGSAISKIYIDNVNISSSSTSVQGVQGIKIYNMVDTDLNFIIRHSAIQLSGLASYGINIESASRVAIENSEIIASGLNSVGIKLNNSAGIGGDLVVVDRSLVRVDRGIALGVYNTSTSTGDNNSIKNSRFVRSGAGNAGSAVVHLEGVFTNSRFDSNAVIAEPGADNSTTLNLTHSGAANSLTMNGNTIVQSLSSSPAFTISGNQNLVDFSKNSFAYTGTLTNNTQGAVRVLSGFVSINTTNANVAGGNLTCGVSIYSFASNYVNVSASVSGGLNILSIPSFLNNVVVNTGRCRGL